MMYRSRTFVVSEHHQGNNTSDRASCVFVYQNKTCVQTLEGHMQNVTGVSFHPELPIILTGSEDGECNADHTHTHTHRRVCICVVQRDHVCFFSTGTVRVWHSNTYRLENSLNYDMNRVWCICGRPGTNYVAVGCDEGSIIIKVSAAKYDNISTF